MSEIMNHINGMNHMNKLNEKKTAAKNNPSPAVYVLLLVPIFTAL